MTISPFAVLDWAERTLWRLGGRKKPRGAEKDVRMAKGMPPGHPEWLLGGHRAARTGHFQAWAIELADYGIDVTEITAEHRRGHR